METTKAGFLGCCSDLLVEENMCSDCCRPYIIIEVCRTINSQAEGELKGSPRGKQRNSTPSIHPGVNGM